MTNPLDFLKVIDKELLKEIYGDALKPGAIEVGKSLSTIIGFGNTVLLPFYLANEKAKLIAERNLNQFREKIALQEREKIIPAPPEIGVPILEKLLYVQDKDLIDLYTNLLTTASLEGQQDLCHPKFVNIINSISPDEAIIFSDIAKDPNPTPMISIFAVNSADGSSYSLLENFFFTQNSHSIKFRDNISAYASNLVTLGLIDIHQDRRMIPHNVYSIIESLADEDVKKIPINHVQEENFTSQRKNYGMINITTFGTLFAKACIKKPPNLEIHIPINP